MFSKLTIQLCGHLTTKGHLGICDQGPLSHMVIHDYIVSACGFYMRSCAYLQESPALIKSLVLNIQLCIMDAQQLCN